MRTYVEWEGRNGETCYAEFHENRVEFKAGEGDPVFVPRNVMVRILTIGSDWVEHD